MQANEMHHLQVITESEDTASMRSQFATIANSLARCHAFDRSIEARPLTSHWRATAQLGMSKCRISHDGGFVATSSLAYMTELRAYCRRGMSASQD
jgi:hypothetical protein